MSHFDLFVIGGGSGGVACARRAASYGAKVGLAEGGRMGGTCVIRGCVPKKLMHYGSHFSQLFRLARDYGWSAQDMSMRFDQLLERRNREIQRLNGIYIKMLQKAGVEIFAGKGRLVDASGGDGHAVEVNGERHTATRVLIAVGGRPVAPDIEGIEHVVTSDNILEDIYELPRRFVVVGAGYIGVEIASIMNGLGCLTTLVLRREKPLRGFDEDLRDQLTQGLEHHGVQIRPNTTISSIEKTAGGVVLNTNTGRIEADMVLYATGRNSRANTEDIGIAEMGIEAGKDGSVHVNEQFETSIPGIYAVGDCSNHAGSGLSSGQFDLTPVAIAEGRAVAEALFNNTIQKVHYGTIPTAIFSAPQGASVGMSEAQATVSGMDVEVYTAQFRPMLYTLGEMREITFMKMIVDKATDKLLGCHMVGDDAAEMMQGLAVAMTAGATKADFDNTVGIHPSSAEEFVTMYTPRGSG